MTDRSGGSGDRWALSATDTSEDVSRFRHLVEHIQDAVVEFEFVAGEPIVRGMNPAFVEVFGYDPETVVNAPLNEFIVPRWLADEADALDARTSSGRVNYRRVRRETADGLRDFLYRGVPYEFDDGRTGGFAVYTDLTEDRRNADRLDVLNRLLRHNLRNRVNVVVGGADELTSMAPDDSELSEAATTIGEAAASLKRLTHEATEIHRTLQAGSVDDPRVDCVELVETVADTYRERYPEATILTTLPEELHVAATSRLEVAIGALVDNAITHNPADEPRVWIEVETVPDSAWVDVVVGDDGPTIPPVEREVVEGTRDITPMEHGSGLGLWLVKWTVERFGGELRFGTSPAGGNRVELRLPRYRDAP